MLKISRLLCGMIFVEVNSKSQKSTNLHFLNNKNVNNLTHFYETFFEIRSLFIGINVLL